MKKHYLIYGLCIIVGFAVGSLYFINSGSEKTSAPNVRPGNCPYKLISPLRCGDDVPAQTEYSVFKKKLLEELDGEVKKGKLSAAALYFRDLNNGPTFYFNEQLEFAPMSLLKLPMMIAVYKYAESNPKLLEEKLHTPSAFGKNEQVMEPSKTLSPDTDYTIDEIVRYMIVYSDNRAIDMLSAWLEDKGSNYEVLRRTLSDLGIVGYEASLDASQITVKQYASLFRILYNASYLNAAMSEKALAVLEESEFKEGLTGKLPNDLGVAHKFGVRAFNEGEQQLHDCGIVYFKPSPYMICIMTRGKEYKALSDYIQNASKKVFTEVSDRAQ